MVTFITLFRGETEKEAKVVATSASPELVSLFASALLKEHNYSEERFIDPALSAIQIGKREALKIIKDDADQRVRLEKALFGEFGEEEDE